MIMKRIVGLGLILIGFLFLVILTSSRTDAAMVLQGSRVCLMYCVTSKRGCTYCNTSVNGDCKLVLYRYRGQGRQCRI
jgi:hypothetical protein